MEQGIRFKGLSDHSQEKHRCRGTPESGPINPHDPHHHITRQMTGAPCLAFQSEGLHLFTHPSIFPSFLSDPQVHLSLACLLRSCVPRPRSQSTSPLQSKHHPCEPPEVHFLPSESSPDYLTPQLSVPFPAGQDVLV